MGKRERQEPCFSESPQARWTQSIVPMAVPGITATVCGGQRAPTVSALIQWVCKCGPQPSGIRIARSVLDMTVLGLYPRPNESETGVLPRQSGFSQTLNVILMQTQVSEPLT